MMVRTGKGKACIQEEVRIGKLVHYEVLPKVRTGSLQNLYDMLSKA